MACTHAVPMTNRIQLRPMAANTTECAQLVRFPQVKPPARKVRNNPISFRRIRGSCAQALRFGPIDEIAAPSHHTVPAEPEVTNLTFPESSVAADRPIAVG
jgi:hypothetical protein